MGSLTLCRKAKRLCIKYGKTAMRIEPKTLQAITLWIHIYIHLCSLMTHLRVVYLCVWVCKRPNDRLFIVFFASNDFSYISYTCCCLMFFSAASLLKGKSRNDDTSIEILFFHTHKLSLCWRCDDAINSNKPNKMGKNQTVIERRIITNRSKKAKQSKAKQKSNDQITWFLHLMIIFVELASILWFAILQVFSILNSDGRFCHFYDSSALNASHTNTYPYHWPKINVLQHHPKMLNCMNSQRIH